jgi:hypothetical protein
LILDLSTFPSTNPVDQFSQDNKIEKTRLESRTMIKVQGNFPRRNSETNNSSMNEDSVFASIGVAQ